MAIRLGISAILLIFPKFRRMRKLFWIVVAIELEPLSPTTDGTKASSQPHGRLVGPRWASWPLVRGIDVGIRVCNRFILARQRNPTTWSAAGRGARPPRRDRCCRRDYLS